MTRLTAGLLMYRIKNGEPEVFLVHLGGPYWKNKDVGFWDIPKGGGKEDEMDPLEIAKREFEEETGFDPAGELVELGSFKRKNGDLVHIWMFEGDVDPSLLKSNTCFIDWPIGSGKKLEIPEVDRGEYFNLPQAREKAFAYILPVLDAFERKLG